MTPLVEPAFDIAIATGRTVYDSIYLAPGHRAGLQVGDGRSETLQRAAERSVRRGCALGG